MQRIRGLHREKYKKRSVLDPGFDHRKEGALIMTLELYKFDECPYVQRVMRYIKESGRTDIIYRDINEDKEAEQTLISVGGKRQVPCLFIDGKPMYESLDIIEWLKEHPEEE